MVGSYMGRVFTVSSQRILTPSNLKGSAGSDWANHEIIGKKARSQWVGPKLKSYTISSVPQKIKNIMELLKLEAMVEDLPPQPDRIHVANGTLMLDGRFIEGKKEIVQSRLPVSYNPNAAAPALWLNFLDGLLYEEDIPTLQEFIG